MPHILTKRIKQTTRSRCIEVSGPVFQHLLTLDAKVPIYYFLKMGQSRPLFVYFCPFPITISIQIEKSVDGVLGIRTRGRRMVGADETTELWRPPFQFIITERLKDWLQLKLSTSTKRPIRTHR